MDEFKQYVAKVEYFLGRKATTEDILFDITEHFEAGLYAEQCAEEMGVESVELA